MSILDHAVPETVTFHLRDAAERLMYADKERKLPMRVTLYSPGSKEFARAQSDRNNRVLALVNIQGKAASLTVEESIREKATYLADCTHSWENVDLEGKQGRALSEAIYSHLGLGFIADQNAKRLGDWKDFSRDSQNA